MDITLLKVLALCITHGLNFLMVKEQLLDQQILKFERLIDKPLNIVLTFTYSNVTIKLSSTTVTTKV